MKEQEPTIKKNKEVVVWQRRKDLDVPELFHDDNQSFPQQVGFENKRGGEFTISRIQAVALGMIRYKEAKKKSQWYSTYRDKKERQFLNSLQKSVDND